MTYTKAFFGVDEDEDFDLERAVEAYEWVMANEEIAPFVISKALFDFTTADLEHHRDVIQKASGEFISKRLDDVRRGISRELISKSASGESLEAISKAAEALSLISKEYTTWERQRNVEQQLRDAGGRFRVMNRKILTNNAKGPVANKQAKAMGIPATKLSRDQKTRYQQDYLQVSNALRELAMGGGGEDVLVTATLSNGRYRTLTLPAAKATADNLNNADNGLVRESDYADGHRVVDLSADVYTGRGASNQAQMFDVLTGVGASPAFAAGLIRGGQQNIKPELDQFNTTADSDIGTNQRFWRRTQAAASLADSLAGDVLPPKAQLALKTAKWAAQHEPEAEKVIGPTARKSAYRYRGVEKTPDPIFQHAINQARAQHKTSRDAHTALIQGTFVDVPEGRGKYRTEKRESLLIQAMRNRLPDPELYELNRKSGVIPPSQGIVIDRTGKVVTEAVGYGEDWYLPFNLKNINRMRGGEYIRTRAFGGPTTEDIYAGLVSGARGLTVVSHSGVFHVQFDDTFRGTRRYNDKAARMVKRYGMLLDAVKSKQVVLGGEIPGDRMRELADQALVGGQEGTPGFKAELSRLKEVERREPQISQARKDEIKQSLLDEYARDASYEDWSSFVLGQRKAIETGVRRNAYPDEPESSIQDRVNQNMARYADTDSALEVVGLTYQADKQIRQAQAAYKAKMSPLALDGMGYEKAIQALRDQFPYYISDFTYVEPTGRGLDQGYVKPRYNRPQGALSGYYDPSIEGVSNSTGKYTADQTNYQNYANRKGNVKFVGTDKNLPETKQEEEIPPAAKDPKKAKDDARIAVVESIAAQKTFGANATGMAQRAAGQPFDMTATFFRTRFPLVSKGPEGLKSHLRANPQDSAALDEELAKIRAVSMFDLPSDVWRNFDAGGEPVKFPQDNLEEAVASATKVAYDFPEASPGKPTTAYSDAFSRLVRTDSGKRLGLEATSLTEPADVVLERLTKAGKFLQTEVDLHRTWQEQGQMTAPTVRIGEVKRDTETLAKLYALAHQYRKAQDLQAKEASLRQQVTESLRPDVSLSLVNVEADADPEKAKQAITAEASRMGLSPEMLQFGRDIEQQYGQTIPGEVVEPKKKP